MSRCAVAKSTELPDLGVGPQVPYVMSKDGEAAAKWCGCFERS